MSLDLPTRLDLYALGRDHVIAKARRVSPTIIDTDGSDVNIIVGSASTMARSVIDHLGYEVSQLFLDTVEQERLDRWAFDRYQLTRKGASPARGTVRFFRATSTAGAGSIPIGTKLQTIGGAQYITTSVAVFAAGALEAPCYVRASEAGKQTQASAKSIRTILNSGSLFDPSMQVINDLDTAGGEDAESDDIFKERIRSFWRAARRGVLAAIEFGATTVLGVVSAQAIEVLESQLLSVPGLSAPYVLPARLVTLYISDSSGVASEALANDVRDALNEYRAAGIGVIISTSIPQLISIQMKLTFAANVNTVLLADSVASAVVAYVNSLPVNGRLNVSALYTVLSRFIPDGIIPNDSTIVAPVGDLVPDVGRTLRTTRDLVTVVPA